MGRTNQKAICILGMHRSGTSAIARAVNLLGAYLGPQDQLMPPKDDNPNGFWEHMAIYSYHQRLLNYLCRSWDSTVPLPEEWWKEPGIKTYRDELVGLVKREFGGQSLWLWKDPRTSLLLPLWNSVLQELRIEVCYLHSLRSPLDVSVSLERRNNFSRTKSCTLWLLYTMSAFHWTHGTRRIIIHYDHLLEDPEASLKKVSQAFDIPWPEDDHELRTTMADFLKLDSRHSHADSQLLSWDKDPPETMVKLYHLLLNAEENRNLLDSKFFEETLSEMFTHDSPLALIPKINALPSLEQRTLGQISPLRFNLSDKPQVSIIIPVFNHWKYTYQCLEAILENTDGVIYEVIVVDNGSSDETIEMLKKVENIRILRNDSNVGFVLACNAGASKAQGDLLLFLNNDALVTKGCLKAMLSLIDSDDKIGAVGAKLIYPDGRLQEAGGMIFSDGRPWNFGNGDDPEKEIYNQICEVDYCSGACFLVRKSLFDALGGFDERYSPGFYEEADLSFAMRKIGYKVLYNPEAVVIHHGSVTAGDNAYWWGQINRKKFIEKWESELTRQGEPPSITGEIPTTADRKRLEKESSFEKAKILKNVYALLDALTAERDALKKSYLASEADRAARLEVIERQAKEFSEKIAKLKSSMSWRITAPLRWILDQWYTIYR
jgi:GT2 family glycosyltransferase